MRRIWLLPFLLVSAYSGAQEALQGPYTIPRMVYVGDRAALTLPLAGGNAGREANVSLDPRTFPLSPDLELYRVALEYRPSGRRLLIEFTAFTPGLLELPPIEIGGERFAGLHVEISSVLEPGETGAVLSGPAPPLAIPGTSLLVYGTMGIAALLLLLALWAGLWGRRHLGVQILKWRRRRLIISMWGIERHLRRSVQREGKYRDALNKLSGEFRGFLSFFTGQNCRAMTAAEIGRLPPLGACGTCGFLRPLAAKISDFRAPLGVCKVENTQNCAFSLSFGLKPHRLLAPANDGSAPGKNDAYANYAEYQPGRSNGGFLGGFFSRCDELRFSGSEIAAGDVLAILGDLRRFLKMLDRAERGTLKAGGEAA